MLGLEGEGRLVMNSVCIDTVLLLPMGPGPCPPVTFSPDPLPCSAIGFFAFHQT